MRFVAISDGEKTVLVNTELVSNLTLAGTEVRIYDNDGHTPLFFKSKSEANRAVINFQRAANAEEGWMDPDTYA
jgi:hypothetical protein